MNKLFTVLFTLSLIISANVFADQLPCRSAVVLAYASFNEKISEEEFSSTNFSELNMSYTQFNSLSSTEQDVIYRQIKPIEVMVEETIGKLNRYINRYVGTFYEMYMIDEIQNWRESRDNLRSCIN